MTTATPTRRRGNVIFACFLIAMFFAFAVFAFTQIQKRNASEDACVAAGGIPVKSHLGPLVCVNRDALIPDPDWRR